MVRLFSRYKILIHNHVNSKQIFYKAYCTVLYSRLFLCVKMLGFANVIRLCLYGFELYHTHSNAIMQIIKII